MSNQSLIELKGTNGTILVYDDRVVIKRKGFFAVASQGIKGDTTFFYNSLSGVDFKKPGFTNGYIRFVTAGTKNFNSKTGLFGSSLDSTKDPNTVILRAFNRKIPALSEELYNIILKKISEVETNTMQVQQLSSADEIIKFKSLLDQGIITQTEFDEKKKQLLNT